MPECVVCDEVITQPLCAECLEHQVRTWLHERLPDREDAIDELRALTEDILFPGGVTTCIKCGAGMRTCSYCYTEHLLTWIRHAFPELVGEFLTHFSFSHEPLGYERELRRAEMPKPSLA